MHNRAIVKHIFSAVVFLMLCLFGSQPVKAVTDDCSTGKIWRGYLYDENTDTWTEYLPEEFFTDSLGAVIPNYDEDDPKMHPYFEMQDTACATDNWSIRFTGYTHTGYWGESLAVTGIDIIGFTPNPSLKDLAEDEKIERPHKRPAPAKQEQKRFEIRDSTTNKHNIGHGLKASISKYEMGFDYHDDTIYFYRNGITYRKEPYHVCKMINPTAYWEKYGGRLERIDYWDYTNGTEYHEDFSDCSQTQEFPECEPQPEVTIEATFELPNCLDDTLRLKVTSNLLEDFHWEGPNGWTSTEQNPTLSYEDAVSGKYLVWSKLDPCSEPVYVLLDIKIPKLKSDTVYQVSTCHGDTVKIGDHFYTENGLYIDTLKTEAGCDSIVYTFLDFHYRESVVNDTFCTGGTYIHHGLVLTEPGTYTDTIKVAGCNCDSIVTLNLYAIPIENEIRETICKGNTYEFGDTTLYTAGTYIRKFKTPDGCDSTVTLHLTVNIITSNDTVVTCEGKGYQFGDSLLYTPGDFSHTFKTKDNCDSTVYLNFRTFPIIYYDSALICTGSFLMFGDTMLTTSGIYSRKYKAPDGCNNTEIMCLSVHPITNLDTVTICVGNSYVFGDTTIYSAGTYVHKFRTEGGCDSTVTLCVLTDSIIGEENVSICEGSSYEFGDSTYAIAGDYVHRFKTSEGCDSIVTLHLKTYPITGYETVTICEGGSYEFGDTILHKAGKYVRKFKTAQGCDSTVTLTLYTVPIIGHDTITICEGSSYLFGDTTLQKSGKYIRKFKTPGGCDSTVYLVLYTEPIATNDTVTICIGSYYLFGDTILKKPGKYIRKFKTPDGCDSTVTLRLYTEPIREQVYAKMCEGGSYVFGDTILNEAGNYKRTFKTQGGCDSTVYLNLRTYPNVVTVYDTICKGQEYVFNDSIYTKSGTYKHFGRTANGCDSTTILRLTVTRPGPPTVIPLTLCKGDSLVYNGHVFSQVGSFRDTLTDQHGCDSMVVYKVTFGYQHDTTFIYRTCEEDLVQTIDGNWFNQDTTYTVLLDFDNYECKVKTRIIVYAAHSVRMNDTTIHLCGKHHLRVNLDSLPKTSYQWMPNVGVVCPTCSSTDISFTGEQVSYQVALSNGYCYDTMNVEVETTPNPIVVAAGVNQEGENLVILVKSGTEPYYYQIDSVGDWHSSIDFEKLDIGVHMAYVKDDKGCIAKKRFSYYVPVIPAKLVSPNGDGVLDTWEIRNLELYKEYTIKIFDRWGKLLKTYHNSYDGWDGTYNGHLMPSTDYWYTIVVQENDQEEVGHFTLVRF